MRRIKPKADRGLRIELDWRATFAAFCSAHGNNPVEHGGRLLFADGWTHSASSYRGPQFPPPANPDELAELQRAYWQKRLATVEAMRAELQARLQDLEQLQKVLGSPLMAKVRYQTEDDEGRLVTVRGTAPVDTKAHEERLRGLALDVAHCWKMLNELKREAA